MNPEQDSDTDFILKTQHGEFRFQTTLSDVPGRRMGDDHKQGPEGKIHGPHHQFDRGTGEGASWIADDVRKKVAKNYSAARKLNLLIYANFATDALDYHSICTRLHEYHGQFASLWVVTNHQICSVMSYPALAAVREFRLIHDPQERAALVQS